MHRAGPVLALLTLLMAVPAAIAQTMLPSFEERTGWPLPQSGIYYDPAQPGVGFSFDIGLDGTLLGGFGTYGADGRSVFYTVQGRVTRDGLPPADAATVGVLRSPVYLSRRIGAADAADARVVTEPVPALGEATVRFIDPRRLTIDIAGQRWTMQRMALTEAPSEWISGRFLMLVEPRADAALRWPVLAQVSIGPTLRMQALPAPTDGACSGAGAVAEARFVTCETGCGAFQEWAGGRLARVVVWPNGDGTTWQLGRYVEGADGLVPLPGGVQYTLSPSPLSLDALPQAQGCRVPGEALRLYRSQVPQYVVATPVGPAPIRYALGSLRAGTWWDPARPGRGIVIDVGGRVSARFATGMVGVFDFRDDGNADFSTIEGLVQSPNPGMLWAEVLGSPLYRHRDGQCIGCPWRAPTTVADEAGLQLFFEGGPEGQGVLTVRRMSGFREVARNQYVRFPIDRSAFDEVRGRWLMRIQDPALTGTSTAFATLGQRIPAYAEVVFEPLTDAAVSAASAGSPLYRVACTAACGEFERWKALAGDPADPSPRDVVLWFERASAVAGVPGAHDPATGRLGVLVRGAQGLRFVDAASYRLSLSARDRFATVGEGTRVTQGSTRPAGSVDFFRNPPRAFAD